MDVTEITGAWDYSSLPANVHIGRDCYLERRNSFASFRSQAVDGLRMGNRVRVYTRTEFNVEPSGRLEIGDDCILAGAVFMCASLIVLGHRVVVSYNVTLADSDFHPHDPKLRRADAIANAPHGDRSKRPPIIAQPIRIEDDVWIGIGAIVLKGVTIGAGARVGAGSVVTRDVPAGVTVVGNPARIAHGQQLQ